MSVPLCQMALFLALPLWQALIRNRNRPAVISAMGQTSFQEEYVVYLDQDSILLPTVPPPPYAEVDPNPPTMRARRPVALLVAADSVETTETFDAIHGTRDGDGLCGVEFLGNNENPSTPKRRASERELSAKAVLSVVVFLLAIVGIAWIGSMAVNYTWQSKVIIKDEPTLEHTVKAIYESLVEADYPLEMTSSESSQASALLQSLSDKRSSTIGTSTIETSTISSTITIFSTITLSGVAVPTPFTPLIPQRIDLSKVVLSPELLQKCANR